jgi:hypothetical protein
VAHFGALLIAAILLSLRMGRGCLPLFSPPPTTPEQPSAVSECSDYSLRRGCFFLLQEFVYGADRHFTGDGVIKIVEPWNFRTNECW